MPPQPTHATSASRPGLLQPDTDDVMLLLDVPADRMAWARRAACDGRIPACREPAQY